MLQNIWQSWSDKLQLQRFFRGEGPQPGPYVCHRRRVFILPTRTGVSFSVFLFVMFVGAVNYSNSLGYLLAFLLTSLLVVSILHTYKNILNLEIAIAQPEAVFCGDNVVIPVHLYNKKNFKRLSLQLGFPDNIDKQFDLNNHETTTISLSKATHARGYYPVGRLRLQTIFPLGLFQAWAIFEFDRFYYVYPKPSDSDIAANLLQQQTDDDDSLKESGEDFNGLREYVKGDSMRHIHWKASAHTHLLLTKLFSGYRTREVIFDYDALPSMDMETKLSILARLVLLASQNDILFGLRLPDSFIELDHGKSHAETCLKSLAVFNFRK